MASTKAVGDKVLEGAVIQELDDKFQLIGEPKKIDCDIICMAVGLTPTTELFWQAGCKMQFVPQLCGYVPFRDKTMQTSSPDIWVAGDASGIEEASAAMVEGRIAGHSAAKALGHKIDDKKFDEYWTRLHHLRAGEVGEKILAGIDQVLVERWEA